MEMTEDQKAFEKWALRTICNEGDLGRGRLTGYANQELNQMYVGWRAALAHARRWIPVGERLPTGFACQRVLILTKDKQVRETLFAIDPKTFQYQYAEGLSAHFEWAAEEGREVIAWQPLPPTEGLE